MLRPLGLRRKLLYWLLLLLTLYALLLSWKNRPKDPLCLPVVLNGVRAYNRYNVNCEEIYEMDPMEVGKSLILRRKPLPPESDGSLVKLTSDCRAFVRARGYDGRCVSDVEEDFPLAYSMVVHKYAWMVERLIRAVYSPNNVYCIHYDLKSPSQFIAAMEGLARCLPNVFIASKLEVVNYAGISRLKADLNCLSDLLMSEVKWKYVINLCGQDFPLRTNIELVAELKKLNGANMLETARPTAYKKQRFTFHHKLTRFNLEFRKTPEKTTQKKTPPPHGIEMFTGNAYFVLSRAFIDYVNTSDVAKDFLSWSEDTFSPDEHFWATLVRIPGVPGEVLRSAPDITDLMSKTRLVKWAYLEGNLYPQCTGTHVRGVCIYGAAELRWLLNYGHWFANKFDTTVDPVVVQCLEERLEENCKAFHSVRASNCQVFNFSQNL